jgi:hypothetical protein
LLPFFCFFFVCGSFLPLDPYKFPDLDRHQNESLIWIRIGIKTPNPFYCVIELTARKATGEASNTVAVKNIRAPNDGLEKNDSDE